MFIYDNDENYENIYSHRANNNNKKKWIIRFNKNVFLLLLFIFCLIRIVILVL